MDRAMHVRLARRRFARMAIGVDTELLKGVAHIIELLRAGPNGDAPDPVAQLRAELPAIIQQVMAQRIKLTGGLAAGYDPLGYARATLPDRVRQIMDQRPNPRVPLP